MLDLSPKMLQQILLMLEKWKRKMEDANILLLLSIWQMNAMIGKYYFCKYYMTNNLTKKLYSWTIYKRYSQFEVLHWLLVRRFADEVPEFPPKREFICMLPYLSILSILLILPLSSIPLSSILSFSSFFLLPSVFLPSLHLISILSLPFLFSFKLSFFPFYIS